MRGLVLMPVAAGIVVVAILAIICADADRSKRARVARPATGRTPNPTLRGVADASHVAWIWCVAWAWWTRDTVGDAHRRAAGRLRATRAWPATERTLHIVGEALRTAAQLDGDRDLAARRPHDAMASRRRVRPRSVPSWSSQSELGDLHWSSVGRFSASGPIDERRGHDDADENDRVARQRQSA